MSRARRNERGNIDSGTAALRRPPRFSPRIPAAAVVSLSEPSANRRRIPGSRRPVYARCARYPPIPDIHSHTHTYAFSHTYTHTHTHKHDHKRTLTHIHTNTHRRTYSHIHTYTRHVHDTHLHDVRYETHNNIIPVIIIIINIIWVP